MLASHVVGRVSLTRFTATNGILSAVGELQRPHWQWRRLPKSVLEVSLPGIVEALASGTEVATHSVLLRNLL